MTPAAERTSPTPVGARLTWRPLPLQRRRRRQPDTANTVAHRHSDAEPDPVTDARTDAEPDAHSNIRTDAVADPRADARADV